MLSNTQHLTPITAPHLTPQSHTVPNMSLSHTPIHTQQNTYTSNTSIQHTNNNTTIIDPRIDIALLDSTSHTYTTATVQKSRSTHTWHLKGFSHLPRSTSKPVTTTFHCSTIQWELRLFAYGENDDDQLSLFLHMKNAGIQSQVTCKFTFKLLATNNQHYCKGTNGRAFTFNKQKSAFGCPLLIHRQTLLSNTHLLHDDTLIIVTELEMATDLNIIDATIQSPLSLTNNTTAAHLHQLSHDMHTVINSQPDLYLLPTSPKPTHNNSISVPIDSLELDEPIDRIPVHRVILCARSPVFNAMLNKQFLESETNTIVLHDITKFTLQKLIEYIYTGTLQPCSTMQWKQYVELYEAAVKYGVELLTELCAHHITMFIDTTNIVHTLQLCESYKNVTGASIIKHACKTKMIQEFDEYITVFNTLSTTQSSNTATVQQHNVTDNILQLPTTTSNDIFAPTPDSKKRRLFTIPQPMQLS